MMFFKSWTRVVRSSIKNGTSSSTNRASVSTICCISGCTSRLVVSISSNWFSIDCDLFLLRVHLLLQLSIEALEALRVGHCLRITTRSVLRAFADIVELFLRLGGFPIDLGLRGERLLQLGAGRCGECGRHQRHQQVDPPWASSCRYFSFERNHDNKRLLKITCTRLAPAD